MNYHTDEYIQSQVRRHYEEAKKRYPEDKIVGIFLCGSANYSLDSEGSDTDTKLIVLPSFSDVVKGKQLYSVCHELENGEHIEAKDIREMMRMFKKSNMNFLEILCTPYYILNPEYAEYFKPLQDNCDFIARIDNHAYINTIRGIAERAYSNIFKDIPSTHDMYIKHGWSAKFMYRLLKEQQMLSDFINGVKFSEALTNSGQEIAEIKNNGYQKYSYKKLNLNEVEKYAEDVILDIRQRTTKYLLENERYILSAPEQIMYTTTQAILRKSFQHDWELGDNTPVDCNLFT